MSNIVKSNTIVKKSGFDVRAGLANALKAKSNVESLYLLLDASGSMHGDKWKALNSAIEVIKKSTNAELTYAFFNNELSICEPHEMHPDGGTRMYSAIQAMYTIMAQGGRIVLLSDGHPTDEHDVRMYQKLVSEHNIIIDTVGIGSGVDDRILKAIADATGGYYSYCPDGLWSQMSQLLLDLTPERKAIAHAQ